MPPKADMPVRWDPQQLDRPRTQRLSIRLHIIEGHAGEFL